MTLETVVQAQAHFAAEGFTEELVVDGHELRGISSGIRYAPTELEVAHLVRFQGITSTEEEGIVFALAASDLRPLGTYAPALRPAPSADDAKMVAQLNERAIPVAEIDSHAGHDHVAAVFADRSTAEAAIDDLRELGFGNDRLGVALREGASLAFERNAEVEFGHATVTGAAAGGAIGFLTGLSIAAIALVPGGLIGVGGILAFGAVGGLGGAYFGGFFGEAVHERALNEREELAATHLEPGQVLVATCSHGHPAAVQAIMERHGGELLLRPRGT
jgi:hypothetical protein